MNEQQWLASEDVVKMLAFVSAEFTLSGHEWPYRVSARKLRLFACACLRAVPRDVVPGGLSSVDVTERFADGHHPTAEERQKYGNWTHTADGLRHMLHFIVGHRAADRTAQAALLREVAGNPFRPIRCPHSAGIDPVCLRCRTDWRNPTVLSIARAAYDERLPDGTLGPVRLAVLADALEDSGCPSEEKCTGGFQQHGRCYEFQKYGAQWETKHAHEACRGTGRVPHPVRAHLRSPGPHVRGCAVIDWLLGKE